MNERGTWVTRQEDTPFIRAFAEFDPDDGATGTAAMLEVNGRRFFGANGSINPSTLKMRRGTFEQIQATQGAVSYTHLTLPTKA